MTMQDKILKVIESTASQHNLEIVRSFSYSNIGTLYVQRPDALKSLFLISVDFQSDYMSAAIYGPEETKPVYGQFSYLPYKDEGKIQQFLSTINQRMAGEKK